jgi:hypothetical protein
LCILSCASGCTSIKVEPFDIAGEYSWGMTFGGESIVFDGNDFVLDGWSDCIGCDNSYSRYPLKGKFKVNEKAITLSSEHLRENETKYRFATIKKTNYIVNELRFAEFIRKRGKIDQVFTRFEEDH